MTRACCRCGTTLRFTQYHCSNCGHRVQACTGFGCKEPLTIGAAEDVGQVISAAMRAWWERRKETA